MNFLFIAFGIGNFITKIVIWRITRIRY